MTPPTLLFVHLGNGTPPYLRDCVHQLRLFNPRGTLRIVLILDPVHRGSTFLQDLTPYDIHFRYTDTLPRTPEHEAFIATFKGDTSFRNGYWQFVKQRFFYIEEFMREESLTNVIALEYDVLVYAPIQWLLAKIIPYTDRLTMVKDNPTRSHPGFLFIPNADAIHGFNSYIVGKPEDDMTLLCSYGTTYPDRVKYFPVLTPARNASIPARKSLDGNHYAQQPDYLSQGFEQLSVLFDSAVIGQFIGGIDSRNTGGILSASYDNEAALYLAGEMSFEWIEINGLWIPILDTYPLVTIHMHSKFLQTFLSDNPKYPRLEDSNITELMNGWPWV